MSGGLEKTRKINKWGEGTFIRHMRAVYCLSLEKYSLSAHLLYTTCEK